MAFAIKLRRRRFDADGNPAFEDENAYESRDQNPAIVRIGVDGACDIRVPPERRVKHRHCTLIYTGSGFRLDFEGDANVFIGELGGPNEPINITKQAALSLCDPFLGRGNEIVLRLGEPVPAPESPGVDIFIKRTDPNARERANQRRPPKRQNDLTETVRREREKSRWARRIAVIATPIAAVVLVFGFFALTEKVERLETYTDAVLAEMEPKVGPSVGLIGVDPGNGGAFQSVGTGWLCCRDSATDKETGNERFVVTNAHVLEQALAKRQVAGPGAVVQIVFPAPPGASSSTEPTRIALSGDGFIHPLYGHFESFIKTSVPDVRSVANVFDVARFELQPADVTKLQGEKRAFLALVERDMVNAYSSVARPVAATGYPFENVPLAVNSDSVIPKVFGSRVVRRTNAFVGAYSGADSMPALLAATAESAGGISGSPLIVRVQKDGGNELRVIGILMAGSFSEDWQRTGGDMRRSAVSNVVFGTDANSIRGAVLSEKVDEVQKAVTESGDQAFEQDRFRTWNQIRTRRREDPLALARQEFAATARDAGCDPNTIGEGEVVSLPMQQARKSDVSSDGVKRASESLKVAYQPFEKIAVIARSPSAPEQLLTIKQENAPSSALDKAGTGIAAYDRPVSDKPGEIELAIGGNLGVPVVAIVLKCQRQS